MIELLCSYGAARELELLACLGDLKTAAAMIAANPGLADNPGALASAAAGGHEGFVRLMLRVRPETAKRVTFPSWSVGGVTRPVTELLIQHGMNPSQPDWLGITALHNLVRSGNVETAEVFLDHGADLVARDEHICSTPLGWAAKFGKAEMVKLLLARGAKLELPDDPPWATPLAWAVRRGHREIAELLKQSRQFGGPADIA